MDGSHGGPSLTAHLSHGEWGKVTYCLTGEQPGATSWTKHTTLANPPSNVGPGLVASVIVAWCLGWLPPGRNSVQKYLWRLGLRGRVVMVVHNQSRRPWIELLACQFVVTVGTCSVVSYPNV